MNTQLSEIINKFLIDFQSGEIWCIYCSFSHSNSIYKIKIKNLEIEFCHDNWGLLWSEIFNNYLIFEKSNVGLKK